MERRDFLAAAAAGATGAAIPGLRLAPAAAKLGDIGLATITVAKGMTEQPAKTLDAVAEIGFDLGFSSQASFSRFFIANGVVPPSNYRRTVYVTAPA